MFAQLDIWNRELIESFATIFSWKSFFFYKQLQFKSVYKILKELELQNIKMCMNNFIKMKFVTIRCHIFYCSAQCPVSRHLFLTSPALFRTSVESNIPWSLKINGLKLYFYCWPFTVAFLKKTYHGLKDRSLCDSMMTLYTPMWKLWYCISSAYEYFLRILSKITTTVRLY